jgi:hypothetical protein
MSCAIAALKLACCHATGFRSCGVACAAVLSPPGWWDALAVQHPAAPDSLPRAGARYDDVPYLGPEVLEGGEPSTAADCFAFGIIMYEVFKRELVAAEIAMHADLNEISDEDALKWHASRIVEGERCATAAWLLDDRHV